MKWPATCFASATTHLAITLLIIIALYSAFYLFLFNHEELSEEENNEAKNDVRER